MPADQLTDLLDPARWEPLPHPPAMEDALPVRRRDPRTLPPAPATGSAPEVLSRSADGVLLRLRHRAPRARAVALHASGWWRPQPADALDLVPAGDGWWEIVLEAPEDWRASYGFVEHDGPGDPPWWDAGLKAPGAPVHPDALCAHRHGAARGGAERSVLSLPFDGLFRAGRDDAETPAEVHDLPLGPDAPRVRWWAPEEAGSAPLPLLVVTDGAEHVEQLGTPERLRRGVEAGVLPPLVAVFVDAGEHRGDVLGVPGGQATWIPEELVPQLRAAGLTAPGGRRLAVTDDPARTIITGASYGGLTALFTAARAPGTIGVAIAQSVSLWRYPDGALVGPLREAAGRAPLRLRLHAGRFEGTMAADARALADALDGSGADVTLDLHSGGHDWAWWQPALLHDLAAGLGR